MLMSSGGQRAATLIYGPSGFRVVKSGDFVTCAVTGEAIPLEELRYWSVEKQEPYASAQIATRRILGEA
ncbi:DUF2093 domain-containing protein [Altericroceibacterium spongiae]|uniref:DUF2093 domain-containing protein n=1 Tax=Altericroceibacterium spongiae TaxID=2320269 RepID=A0A420EE87_9SPHN|nr:DUF2093 domain-containing protein [Altericroceibacterium spongiae]RKF19001.1 DUF2093 domain-containing protein [Altericroceibacterium spongiae]